MLIHTGPWGRIEWTATGDEGTILLFTRTGRRAARYYVDSAAAAFEVQSILDMLRSPTNPDGRLSITGVVQYYRDHFRGEPDEDRILRQRPGNELGMDVWARLHDEDLPPEELEEKYSQGAI